MTRVDASFITFGGVYRDSDGELTSDLASARYRMLIPGRQLGRLGYHWEAVATGGSFWNDSPERLVNGQTVVFSKSADRRNEQLAAALRDAGRRVVVDICDNHFDHPKHGPHYHAMVALADVVVANTEAMAAIIRERMGRDVTVIGDPVEGSRGTAAFAPRFPRVKALWFGHPLNLDTLQAHLPGLNAVARHLPIQLEIMTALLPGVAERIATFCPADQPLSITVSQWSKPAAWQALAGCDVVWLPSTDHPGKSTKSPNRLTESLWAGRAVTAHPLPSYLPYSEFAHVVADPSQALLSMIDAAPGEVERIAAGQGLIAATLLPCWIGQQWESVLFGHTARPVKLNLGCGDKILPGYINVDVVESRRGQRPDVLCDLAKLDAFPDASVDEILSVHVVEHLWRWDVDAVLREWVRVLKPGGKMILECPNLESACRTFLEDPLQRSRADAQGQRSMWVFYGDPAWRDPYMVHRWGYTPASLAGVMVAAGLVEVRQEPAQFKLREPRDMRLVGIRPRSS